MAHQVEMLAGNPEDLNSTTGTHMVGCPLTSIHVPWHQVPAHIPIINK